MLCLIKRTVITDEGFCPKLLKNVFFMSLYIFKYIYLYEREH